MTGGNVSSTSNKYIAQEISVTPASSRIKLSSNRSYIIQSLATKSIHSMYPASDKMVEEDIIVPIALLASAEACGHGTMHKGCKSYQSEELHVPKRRQTRQKIIRARSSRKSEESQTAHASFPEPDDEDWPSNVGNEGAHSVQPGPVTGTSFRPDCGTSIPPVLTYHSQSPKGTFQ